MRVHRVPAARFGRAVRLAGQRTRHGRLVIETLGTYSAAEYGSMRCYLTVDGDAGFAVRPDGDLVSVFNVGRSGRGDGLVRAAIRRGASRLDAFDENGYLPRLYARHGFVEVHRESWDDRFAPAHWSGARPDVVYMERRA